MIEKLFRKIREGDEEEAREIVEGLYKSNIRGATVAIVARNFSHSIGNHIISQANLNEKE